MASLGPFLEILIGGLLAGVLYSLVALGFVLIFKASGVFNFAQGSMVLLAGLALVRSLDWLVAKGFPVWAAIVAGLLFAALVMAITAFLVERYVLGPLVNQDGLSLFMSTIGVTFFCAGSTKGRMLGSKLTEAFFFASFSAARVAAPDLPATAANEPICRCATCFGHLSGSGEGPS